MDKKQTLLFIVPPALKLIAAFIMGKYGVDIAKSVNIDTLAVDLVTAALGLWAVYDSFKTRKTLLNTQPPANTP